MNNPNIQYGVTFAHLQKCTPNILEEGLIPNPKELQSMISCKENFEKAWGADIHNCAYIYPAIYKRQGQFNANASSHYDQFMGIYQSKLSIHDSRDDEEDQITFHISFLNIWYGILREPISPYTYLNSI